MSNPVTDNPEDPVDDQLTEVVSYLDAELDDTSMNNVEMRLVKDASLREYADVLDRTWQLLDALEEVSADEGFTRKTLDSITTEALQESQTTDGEIISPVRAVAERIRQRKIIPWFLAGVLGTCLGLVVAQRLQQRRHTDSDTAILKNLDLLDNYFRYRAIPDVEALRQLQLPDPPATVERAEP